MFVIKKIPRWVVYSIVAILALVLLILALVRFVVFPNIGEYKSDIAAHATKTMVQKVTIGNIVTGWDDLSPHFTLQNIDVFDAENRSALHLSNVEATLSWLSLPLMQPRLSYLTVHQPSLIIRRKLDGSIYIAGINLAGEGKPDFANWLLSQAKVKIKNANLIWQDELRQAPALSFNKLNLTLENPAWRRLLGHHVFKLTAVPSVGTAKPLIAKGSFFGRNVSKIKAWHGKLTVEASDADLTAWAPWWDYPMEVQSGTGNGKIWLDFANSQIDEAKADFTLVNLSAKLKHAEAPFVAEHFSGHVSWNQTATTSTFGAQNIKLKASAGININHGSGHISHSIKHNSPWLDIAINLDEFSLASIEQLQTTTTLPQELSDKLAAITPRGTLKNIALRWVGDPKNPSRYQLKSEFTALGINAYEKIPGFENLKGNISADQDGGKLELASSNVTLDLEDILRWPIPASQLNGKVIWKTNHNKPKIIAKDIFISSPHITGTINASYDMNGIKGGHLDLSGNFSKGNAKYALFYYPIMLGETTLHWLDTSILEGKAEDVLLTVKGNLADFPYVSKRNQLDPKLGLFRVTAKVSDVLLEYGTGWPVIDGLTLDLLFEGKRMELNAYKGFVAGNKIIKSKTEIPQLDADWPMLMINSEVEGSVADGVQFVNNSPVKEVTLGFTDGLKTAGNGKLNLELKIPMEDLEAAKYKGSYKITNGTIYANTAVGLPEISKINGVLAFTESSLSAPNVNAELFGDPAKFSLRTGAGKIIYINASGRVSDTGIKKMVPNVITEQLYGSTDWTGEISIKKPLVDLSIRSNLLGLAIQLPAPLGKTAQEEVALAIHKKQTTPMEDTLNINYGNVVSALIVRSDNNGALVFDRGGIGINTPAEIPSESGLALRGKFDYVNADNWLALLGQSIRDTPNNGVRIKKAYLSIQKLDIFSRRLNALTLSAEPNNSGLKLAIDSQEINGEAEWQSAINGADGGKIIARLKNLTIPNNHETLTNLPKKDIKRLDSKYPALDITAENFQIGNKKLGGLELNAFESEENWIIQKLKISNP
ncbi:MAG: YhdP family phospholipid transporter, partial [Methylophilaceae bacterium]